DLRRRDARRKARDGIDLQLGMFELRHGDLVGDDDESALERELSELLAAGVVPAGDDAPSDAGYQREHADVARRYADARTAAADAAAELRGAESQIGDLVTVDEEIGRRHLQIERLEAFGAAVELAAETIEKHTRDAHRKFARRLEDYAAATLARITDGRYAELRVDPSTLTIKARIPETGEIVEVDRLSTGTRIQVHLIVRLAIAKMLAEGLEPLPLVLDDPFAFWDEERIARGFPILSAAAADAQTIVLTNSREFAGAAAKRGVHRIELAPED
ncbi:MAG: ATP-binding protein, partial [Vulcanimicrobiaceae bacterium]